jgi:hypothetical protein
MPSARFETAIPGTQQLQTHALDRAATGIGTNIHCLDKPSSFTTLETCQQSSLGLDGCY